VKTHTLRGRAIGNSRTRIILDDGRFNHAMVVKEFYVWAKDTLEDPACILSLNEESGNEFDASNGAQIAWARQVNGSQLAEGWSVIDPDHVVVRDLFINNIAVHDANYLIVLESKTITDDEAILQLIKEGQQNV
jgi:hypothetical protein